MEGSGKILKILKTRALCCIPRKTQVVPRSSSFITSINRCWMYKNGNSIFLQVLRYSIETKDVSDESYRNCSTLIERPSLLFVKVKSIWIHEDSLTFNLDLSKKKKKKSITPSTISATINDRFVTATFSNTQQSRISAFPSDLFEIRTRSQPEADKRESQREGGIDHWNIDRAAWSMMRGNEPRRSNKSASARETWYSRVTAVTERQLEIAAEDLDKSLRGTAFIVRLNNRRRTRFPGVTSAWWDTSRTGGTIGCQATEFRANQTIHGPSHPRWWEAFPEFSERQQDDDARVSGSRCFGHALPDLRVRLCGFFFAVKALTDSLTVARVTLTRA